MKRIKQSSKRRALITILIVMVMALIVTATTLVKSLLELQPDSAISLGISAVETIGLIASLIIAIWQLGESTKISRATFITDLNKAFVENKDYIELYNAFQSCFDMECSKLEKKCSNRYDYTATCNLDFPKGQVSNYLTFFETIYILHKSGVISFAIIDDLFAYRFFLAVHSKFVQQIKLKPQPQNFKNIFCLEYEWLRWRENNGKDADPAVDSVYNKLLLEDLVGIKVYEELTKECRS